MWENERKKTIIRNVFIFLLLVAATTGLLMGIIYVKKQISEEDEKLRAENNSQRQELSDARQDSIEAIQQTYESHLQVVAQYLPGVVCWGDSLTSGSSGNVSYPFTLQEYINAYICSTYDLRYSLENEESYSRLSKEDYTISVPVVNMGAGQEDSATILGRCGVVPYVVKSDFVIPAGTESVPIEIQSESGKAVEPLTSGSVGVNPVTIAGVQGTLTLGTSSQSWGQQSYQFTRLKEGEETPVAQGAEIVTSCKEEYRDYIHIVWLGTYGEYGSPEKLVSDTKLLLQRQQINKDRYLVIGPCTVRGSWTNASKSALDAIDSAMLQEFGNRYINLRKYLVEDGLRDAGITATKADTNSISQGNVPDSFRSNAGGADLNALAYELIGKLVYGRMDRLGYFDEVREALNLSKSTQELLKNDPDYFERLLKSN